MGFVKSLAQLHKIGREQQRNTDVGAVLAQTQQMLDQFNQGTAAPVDSSTAAAAGLVDSVATITSVGPVTGQLNYMPLLQIELLVTLPSGVPVPHSITATVPPTQIGSVQPGRRVHVQLDPRSPLEHIRIDWSRTA